MREKNSSSRRTFAALSVAIAWASAAAWGQTFSSGSTGADGDLIFPNAQPGQVIIFDPTTLNTPLPPNHGSIYNFGIITIPTGVTVKLSGPNVYGPQYWLATGAADIEGTVDVSGGPGYNLTNLISQRSPSIPGVGGFPGGVGGNGSSYPVEPGQGPGGGVVCNSGNGGGGQFTANQFLVPLIGGSGGGGSSYDGELGEGGGAGGGAILIASSVSITVNGTIKAAGGAGGGPYGTAGGGAGGAVRLMASTIQGTGLISVAAGAGTGCAGAYPQSGIIRLEAFTQLFRGGVSGVEAFGSPYSTFIPASGQTPSLTVVSVNGSPVAPNPTGSFTNPDVTFSGSGPVPIVINGANIPSGTQVNLQFYSENGPDIILPNAGALVGSTSSSQVTVMVNLPAGFSRGYVSAPFTQGPSKPVGSVKSK